MHGDNTGHTKFPSKIMIVILCDGDDDDDDVQIGSFFC